MLSQTVWGSGPINHSVIGPAPVIIHPGPLISANVKRLLHEPPYYLTRLCPWEFVMAVFLQNISYKSKLSILFPVQRESYPPLRWKCPEYL